MTHFYQKTKNKKLREFIIMDKISNESLHEYDIELIQQ